MVNRNIAPAIAPMFVPHLLPYRKLTLKNGIEVFVIHDPTQKVFKLDAIFEAGVYYQPQPLVASTTIQMLNEGTRLHNAEAIADLFDYYGAYVDFNCGLNKSELSLISLCKYAPQTISMVAEMLTESIVPEKELEIFLTNKRQEFLVSNEKTSYLARKKFSALLFGEQHPYANQIAEADYSRLTAEDVRDFYHKRIHAGHCRLMVCGNVDDTVLQTLEEHFNRLEKPGQPMDAPVYPFEPALVNRYHTEKKNAVQSSLRIGKSGVRLTDPDYAGFTLLNTILGGYFGSRLMSNIREEKGYTYGINSFNVSMPQGSYWCVATDINNEYVEATIDEVVKEIRNLQSVPVPEAELNLVKNYLQGDLLRELDGVFAQSDTLKHKLNYGLDNGIYLELIRQIKDCTAEELMRIARQYLKIEELYRVTAGK